MMMTASFLQRAGSTMALSPCQERPLRPRFGRSLQLYELLDSSHAADPFHFPDSHGSKITLAYSGRFDQLFK